jgi:hypothetical protein
LTDFATASYVAVTQQVGGSMMGILLGLNAIFWLAGFILPVPCFALACICWFRTRYTPPTKIWRRSMSVIALCWLALGLAFWTLSVVRLYRGADLFETPATDLATLGAALLIVLSAFAERKVRLWLIFGALGLLFFFMSSTGEIAI